MKNKKYILIAAACVGLIFFASLLAYFKNSENWVAIKDLVYLEYEKAGIEKPKSVDLVVHKTSYSLSGDDGKFSGSVDITNLNGSESRHKIIAIKKWDTWKILYLEKIKEPE